MKLYLVQHGDAVAKETDPDRPLSDTGRREVEAVAKFLAGSPVSPQQIWHSGKARARETAELFAQHLLPGTVPGQRPGLAPKDPVAPLRDLLETYEEDLMIVGHLPHLAKLAGLLLSEDEHRTPVLFSKGCVVHLARNEEGQWQLHWMLTEGILNSEF